MVDRLCLVGSVCLSEFRNPIMLEGRKPNIELKTRIVEIKVKNSIHKTIKTKTTQSLTAHEHTHVSSCECVEECHCKHYVKQYLNP